jgi:hypothetical protein
VFRRRRRANLDQGGPLPGEQARYLYEEGAGAGDAWETLDEPDAWDESSGEWDEAAPRLRPGGGPWDAGEAYPERDRADFGSLLVPIMPPLEIEVATDGERLVWVTVKGGASELRVHAFAAPRSSALWDEVREEIVAELASSGARAQQADGPFGTEIFAHVPVEPGAPGSSTAPVRFIGVDGPRWLLRGLIIGPAASGHEPAGPFEDVLRDIVVVRGDHPMPPRDLLELRLPPEIQRALEEQAAAAQGPANRFRQDLNPFERGPEFTETR